MIREGTPPSRQIHRFQAFLLGPGNSVVRHTPMIAPPAPRLAGKRDAGLPGPADTRRCRDWAFAVTDRLAPRWPAGNPRRTRSSARPVRPGPGRCCPRRQRWGQSGRRRPRRIAAREGDESFPGGRIRWDGMLGTEGATAVLRPQRSAHPPRGEFGRGLVDTVRLTGRSLEVPRVDRKLGNGLTRHGPIRIRGVGSPGLNQRAGAGAKGIAPVRAGVHRRPGPVRLTSLGAKAEIGKVYQEMAGEVTHCPVRARGAEAGLRRRDPIHHCLGPADGCREEINGVGRHCVTF